MTIETHESVVRLTLGSASTASGIAASIDAVAGDAEARVLLITGDWDGVCAELTTSAEADPIAALAAVPFPVVASISGACYEQALELALAADVRIASPAAAFRMAHVTHGRMPTHGGTQRLTRTVGRAQAMRMLLTGDALSADDALDVGLLHRIGTTQDAVELANAIARAAPVAARYAKEAIAAAADLPLREGLRLEADLNILLHSTADRAEGLRSFAEKRRPRFQGR